MCNCGTPPQIFTPIPGCGTIRGCLYKYPGNSTTYSGPTITGPNIVSGDTLNIIVYKLSGYIAFKRTGTSTTTTTTTTT